MENNERYSPDTGSGMPHITPEVIETFKNTPHNSSEQEAQFKKTHPEIYQLSLIEAEKYAPGDVDQKRAFARGVLMMCSLFTQQSEVDFFEAKYKLTSDGDGEDQPL